MRNRGSALLSPCVSLGARVRSRLNFLHVPGAFDAGWGYVLRVSDNSVSLVSLTRQSQTQNGKKRQRSSTTLSDARRSMPPCYYLDALFPLLARVQIRDLPYVSTRGESTNNISDGLEGNIGIRDCAELYVRRAASGARRNCFPSVCAPATSNFSNSRASRVEFLKLDLTAE